MHIMLLVVLLFTDGVESAASAPPGNLRDIIATRSLAEVALPPGVLGDGWKPSRGIRIADFAKLDGLPPQEQEIARKLKEQFTPLGVRAVADYTLVRTEFPLNTVTVRVFLFDTPEAAHAWWERKYRHDGWEKYYRRVAVDSYDAVDSLESNKRAVTFGNVWLTASQLQDGDDHITALKHVIGQLTEK